MLRQIQLKNYVSYTDIVFDVPLEGLISISGDVGSGKSALLESIPYALFGVAKVSPKNLVKKGCVNMAVTVAFEVDGTLYEVTRGIHAGGKGFARLRKCSDLIGNGSEVQPILNNILGISGELFMMTAYFGRGIDDTLVDALPSKRLESLQMVANVHQFSKYHKKSTLIKTNLVAGTDRALGAIQAKSEGVICKGSVEEAIKKDKAHLIKANAELTKLKEQVKALRESAISFKGLLEERRVKVSELNNLRAKPLPNTVSLKNHLRHLEERLSSYIADRGGLNRFIERNPRFTKIESDLSELLQEKTSISTKLDMYTAIKNIDLNECPVCSSEILPDKRGGIVKASKDLKVSMVNIEDSIKLKKIELQKVKKVYEEVDTLNKEIEDTEGAIKSTKSSMDLAILETAKIKNALSLIKSRIAVIDTELAHNKGVESKILVLDKKIEDLQIDIGRTDESIYYSEGILININGVIEEIARLQKDYDSDKIDIDCLNILIDAFSRYGIPLQLLTGLKKRISEEATRIYRFFDSGVIEVSDIEYRGNPGIVYTLSGASGEIEYPMLSTGQKVLVGLCVRVAVSFIIREVYPIFTNTLVLDEVAGNLSPSKRESLVRSIVGLLKSHYKQLFVVSHVPLQDCFTHSFKITLEGGGSQIENC